VAEVPLLDPGLPETVTPSLEPVIAADSRGSGVTLAFTGARAMAAWNRRQRHHLVLEGRALLGLVRGSRCPALVVNAAGPASLELSPSQVGALVDRGEFIEESEHAVFVAESLREALPEGFLRFVAKLAGETEEIRAAFVFAIVSERTGSRPAVAFHLDDSADARRRREIAIDAGEKLVLGRGRKTVTVPIVIVEDEGLLDWLRRHATQAC
jgi:hypothetical protein